MPLQDSDHFADAESQPPLLHNDANSVSLPFPHTMSSKDQVHDPVTHLPVSLHNVTSEEFEKTPRPPPPVDERKPTKDEQIASSDESHHAIQHVIEKEVKRNPSWKEDEEGSRRRTMLVIAALSAAAGSYGTLAFNWLVGFHSEKLSNLFLVRLGTAALVVIAAGATYLIFAPKKEQTQSPPGLSSSSSGPDTSNNSTTTLTDPDPTHPESAAWLNALLTSLCPIINPALFTSISDMLEDSMQASLPKMISGVRVSDLGQGSEPVRILGVRWLPRGDPQKPDETMEDEEREKRVEEEDGDYVNLEVGLAYRAIESNASLKDRSKNAHLLVHFRMAAGGVVLPIWVDLLSFLGTARLRITLTPNPPFLSTMTITFIGQPKVGLSCSPLANSKWMNVMDVPGLSGWLQERIDEAVACYVAPKSMTLDLRSILGGQEQLDTDASGVLIVTIHFAHGFRNRDVSHSLLGLKSGEREKRGDVYVTVGWGKWGKPLWSSRVIKDEDTPVWEETTGVLVGSNEVNARERIKVQIWDMDTVTADDSLGVVEVSLKDLIKEKGELRKREDRLKDVEGNEVEGVLLWSVGYFPKTGLDEQAFREGEDPPEVMREKILQEAEAKLREAALGTPGGRDGENAEKIEEHKKEDLKERTDEIVSGRAPSEEWPSGVLSARIEKIDGLEVGRVKGRDEPGHTVVDEEGERLPSAYCEICLDHERVYKTRVKMKSDRPYYDAGTERFIRDWRTTSIMITVRDDRLYENNPILGIVSIPLYTLLTTHRRSQITAAFPLVGGIGYGRMTIHVIFRSIEIKLPKQLLGWGIGTLEIAPKITGTQIPEDLVNCKLVLKTLYGRRKMYRDGEGWGGARSIKLPVKKRYSECFLIQFRTSGRTSGKLAHAIPGYHRESLAFATLWLKDVPDGEEVEVEVDVWRNEGNVAERARTNAVVSGTDDPDARGEEEEDRHDWVERRGQKVGRLVVKVKFWPGLSGYHRDLAAKDHNMTLVMEALDCAEDAKERGRGALNDVEESGSASDDGDSQDDPGLDDDEVKPGGRVTEFREKQKQLHRKHRGLMQWKGVRNFVWMKTGVQNKAAQLGEKVKGKLGHDQTEQQVEKEA